MELEANLVVAWLAAWAGSKARRAAGRFDAEVDRALDVGLDRLHGAVSAKLGDSTELDDLVREAGDRDGVGVEELTRQQVELAIHAAARDDPAFAEDLAEQVAELKAFAAGVVAMGDGSVAVGGSVHVRAEEGSAAALRMGGVHLGPPGRARGPR